jgi:dipeptide/tripeptide permease
MKHGARVRRNWLRRFIGLTICLGPVALVVASLVAAVAPAQSVSPISGMWLAAVALAFAMLNFSLSFLRPLWLAFRRRENARNISGFPILGTIFAVWATLFGYGALATGIVALAALVLDTGGIVWFLLLTWRDEGLWDGAARRPRN